MITDNIKGENEIIVVIRITRGRGVGDAGGGGCIAATGLDDHGERLEKGRVSVGRTQFRYS